MAKIQVFHQAYSPLQRLISLAREKGVPPDYIRSLTHGLGVGGAFVFLFFVWMFLRAEDTRQKLQDQVPSKTALIEAVKPSLPQGDEHNANTPDAEGLSKAIDGLSLPPAPYEGLTENKNGMLLPKARISDDLTPFEAYKRPFKPAVAGQPKISIVIVDYGLSDSLSGSILKNLPPDVTVALNPYSAQPAKWASFARAYGHEFWLSLPMQTAAGSNDTGPLSLQTNAISKENEARLFTLLGTVVGYPGVVTQQGHVLAQDESDMAPILAQIFGRGLAIAESNPDTRGFGLATALESNYPYVQTTLWLDQDLSEAGVEQALKQMETLAMQKGRAIVFVHPYPMALQKVHDWILNAHKKGVQIAPLSAMVE